ncbi:hypothetical protein FH972_007508 [Carpinus fangiana]|uniref:Uncharacterized protein n=1 Tax=Carpinus fangiana TaxID=176857 RepID=A0A5N6QZ59_9ROSI|nr:hypothetical protein FH972_007508 [Carpinus fangiana]
MSTGRHRRQTMLPISRNESNTDNKHHALTLLPSLAYFNLTISSVSGIYRGYIHNDIPMIALIVFVYFAYFWLDHCFTAIKKLPPSDYASPEKRRLQFTIWVLSTAIMFGFACEFATFLKLPGSLFFFAIAIVSSLCIFYTYFIDDNPAKSRPSRSNEKVRDKKKRRYVTLIGIRRCNSRPKYIHLDSSPC